VGARESQHPRDHGHGRHPPVPDAALFLTTTKDRERLGAQYLPVYESTDITMPEGRQMHTTMAGSSEYCSASVGRRWRMVHQGRLEKGRHPIGSSLRLPVRRRRPAARLGPGFRRPAHVPALSVRQGRAPRSPQPFPSETCTSS
jgi:hypothetical protein